MRFDISEKLKKKEEKYQRRLKALEPYKKWHKWFAWHPVTINGQRVWLEEVYRKERYIDTHHMGTEYCDLTDLLKMQGRSHGTDGSSDCASSPYV